MKGIIAGIIKKGKRKLNLKFLFYGKKFLFLSVGLSCIWILGIFQINFLWILIGIVTYMIYSARTAKKEKRFLFGLNLSSDEKATINEFSNLPSWVFFPDFERVEWINKIVARLWPGVSKYLRERVLDKILPKLKKAFKDKLKIKEITFGNLCPKIGGIKFYDNDYLNREEIIIDLDVYYYGNGELRVKYNTFLFGINHLEIKANLRIQLSNFVPKPPFVGAITVTLLENPRISYDFTDAAVLLNIPGINSLFHETILDIISEAVVIPNRIPITLIRNIDIRELMFPLPEGMVRIHIIEGDSLKASDTNIIGKKTSDPYVVIRVGAEKFKTKVIDKNLNPKWNEYFDAIVDTKACQKIEFSVYDKDYKNKDDFLGEVTFDVESVFSRGNIDVWLQLQKVSKGTIHVNLTWLTLSSNPEVFDAIEEKNKKIDAPVASAFLYFSVDSAKNLKRINYDEFPYSYAEVTLGNKHYSTAVVSKSQNPIWENAFHFSIHSVISSDIRIEVKDDKSKKLLGSYSLPISNLLNEKNMEQTQTVSLQNTDGVESTLTFYAALRALEASERKRTSSSSKLSSPSSPDIQRTRFESIPEGDVFNGEWYDETNGNSNKVIFGEADVQLRKKTTDLTEDTNISMDSSSNSTINVRKNSICSETIDAGNTGSFVRVTLRYSNKKVFYIVIHKIQNLVIHHEKNPKIYIKIFLLQKDGKQHKWHTKSVPYNLTMTYDETFQLLIEKDTLRNGTCRLDFKVERQFAFNNKRIGSSEIDFSNWDLNSISKWYPIEIKDVGNRSSLNRMSSRLSTRSKSPSLKDD